MARYSVGFTKVAPATGTFVSQLRTTATKDIRIWEIGCFCSTAVALSVGLIRSLTVGATFTTVTPQADDTSAGAATALCDTAITTQPTITASTYLRKIVLPATIGAGVIWSFPMGIVVPTSAGMLLWNFGAGTGPAVEGYWTYEE
jgi:hypothetical protein